MRRSAAGWLAGGRGAALASFCEERRIPLRAHSGAHGPATRTRRKESRLSSPSAAMSAGGDLGNPLRKFKLVFLGEQSGESTSPGLPCVLKAMHVIPVMFAKFEIESRGRC